MSHVIVSLSLAATSLTALHTQMLIHTRALDQLYKGKWGPRLYNKDNVQVPNGLVH